MSVEERQEKNMMGRERVEESTWGEKRIKEVREGTIEGMMSLHYYKIYHNTKYK